MKNAIIENCNFDYFLLLCLSSEYSRTVLENFKHSMPPEISRANILLLKIEKKKLIVWYDTYNSRF